jgi:hypothetical protein
VLGRTPFSSTRWGAVAGEAEFVRIALAFGAGEPPGGSMCGINEYGHAKVMPTAHSYRVASQALVGQMLMQRRLSFEVG